MELTDFIKVYDDVLSKDECDQFIKIFEEGGGIGKRNYYNDTLRFTQYWLPTSPFTKSVQNKIRIVQSSIAAGSRTITAEITWDEKVTVAGTPQVVIANGNQGSGSGRGPHTLSYTATGSTANRKRFTVASQTVAEDDVLTLGGSNISLNSGTITDTADGSTAASLVLSGLTAVTLTVVA